MGHIYHPAARDTWAGGTARMARPASNGTRRSGRTPHHTRTGAALRRLNEALERQARDMSQALHDESGQLLTSAYIALAHAKRELPPSAAEQLDVVKAHLDGVEEQLRRLAHELRPRILDDLGLVPALKFLAEGIAQRSGMSVRLESRLTKRLPALIETAIYRVAQEALANTRRYASADRVTLRLVRKSRQLRFTVVDNGIGFEPSAARDGSPNEGMGLTSMRDRVEALEGTLGIRSARGGGMQLTAIIPMED
jgi:two-component system NarL family sensor kinase